MSLLNSLWRSPRCLSRRASTLSLRLSLLATGLFVASASALVLPVHSQSGGSPIPTTSVLNVTGTDPFTMSCSVSGVAASGGAGPTGTATFTDATTSATLAAQPLGAATFQTAYESLGPVSPQGFVLAADFNNDGNLDILAGNVVLLGNGDGTFQPGKPVTAGPPANTPFVVGDFNGDGNLDFAWLDIAQKEAYSTVFLGVQVLYGNGDGTFQTSPVLYSVADFDPNFIPTIVQAVDFDGDGYTDLLLVEQQSSGPANAGYFVALNNHQNQFERTSGELGSYVGSSVQPYAWDLQGNGKPDVVENVVPSNSNETEIAVYVGNGDGTFQQPVDYIGAYADEQGYLSGFPSAAGYFNNNGALDLAFITTSGIGFWLGNGDGTFQAGYNYELAFPPGTPTCPCEISDPYILAGDLLRKSEQDLLFTYPPDASYNVYSVWIYGGNGDGTFASPVNYTLYPPLQDPPVNRLLFPAIEAADFNKNGPAELVGIGDGGTYVLSQGSLATSAVSDPSVSVTAGTFANHNLECSYPGDTNYAASTSTAVPETFAQAATPVFSLKVGAYSSAQSVSISDATSGTSIFYTADGSTPTTSSTPYTGPIPVTSSVTLKAIAAGTPVITSQVSEVIYQVPDPPYFSLAAGTYSGSQNVSIADNTANATIFYTTDGTTPSTGSPVYSGQIAVSGATTLQAMAQSGQFLSPVAVISYNSPLGTSSTTLASTSVSTTLTASGLNPAVNLTASITGTKPTGSVSFASNGATLATLPVANGTASFTPSITAAGSYALTASYSGDDQNAGSVSNSVNLKVSPAVSSTVLSASATTLALNQQVTLTAAVTGVSPTGTVTFSTSSGSLGTATVSNGSAALQTSFATAGSFSITASYSGDGNNAASTSSAVTVTVQPTTTSTALSASATSVDENQQVTLTASVTGASPTGTVTFSTTSAMLGKATVSNGSAALQTSFTTAGSYSITAAYSGDASNATSTSSAISITVVAAGFTPGTAPGPQTVSPGATATYQLSFTAQGGYTGAVDLSCSGLPTGASCSFNPSSLKFTGSGSQNTTLSISTTAASSALAAPPAIPGQPLHKPLLFAGFCGLLFGLTRMRRTGARLRSLACLMLLAAAALFSTGCGGSSSGASPTGAASTGTPAGTYTVTVNAVDSTSNLKQTLTVILTVQ